MKFATKRDTNGNRYYIATDDAKKIFSKQPAHWYCKEDFIEISKRDYHKLIDQIINAGYIETEKAL